MSMGIRPDFLIARCEKEIDERRRYLLAQTCNVRDENIISSPDVKSIYEVPMVFSKQDLDKKILKELGFNSSKQNLGQWKNLVSSIKVKKMKMATVAVVGKYFHTGKEFMLADSYAALFEALKHAAWNRKIELTIKWVSAEKVEVEGADKFLADADGIIVPIGWGVRGAEGKIKAIRFARENKVPYLGLCYGMQLACVEFARNVLGLSKANTTENDPATADPIIADIPERPELMRIKSKGVGMRLGGWEFQVKTGTLIDKIYKSYNIYKDRKNRIGSVRHRHRYEFNNKYREIFEKNKMVMAAISTKGNFVDWIELPQSVHPFFIGTQGHPEYSSRPLKPHPVFVEFLNACV